MPKNYLIAIGGTGARCLEATIYLAAAGLVGGPLHVLMVDPDQDNGNVNRTRKIIPLYYRLHGCGQPRGAKNRGLAGGWPLREPILFRQSLNLDENDASKEFPFFWQDPNDPEREFSESIDHTHLSDEFKDFVSLFYEPDDLTMKLGKGYRGRPNIGAVTLISDLRRTANTAGKGLREFINSLRTDLLQPEDVRVFIFGSVFGGTGAAGLPTIPELLREFFDEHGHSEKLRFGCTMMTPYFTFPKATALNPDGPSPDSAIHQVATQAALLHYSHEPPAYQHVYVVGAPSLEETNPNHKPGGDEQKNNAHYAELVAALSARDFFSLPKINQDTRHLHYTDGEVFTWATMPAASAEGQKEIKQKLLAFTTVAYLYHHVLHRDCKNERWYSKQAWYVDNFVKRGGLTLANQGETLSALDSFLGSYLEWLKMVGDPIKDDKPAPFNWSALQAVGDQALTHLGRLTEPETNTPPPYEGTAYGRIMELVNRLRLSYGGNSHPVGVLIYLLGEAATRFCVENYKLSA